MANPSSITNVCCQSYSNTVTAAVVSDITFSLAGVVLRSACRNVCLHSKTTCPNFTKFSVHVNCGRSSVPTDDNAVHYILLVL